MRRLVYLNKRERQNARQSAGFPVHEHQYKPVNQKGTPHHPKPCLALQNEIHTPVNQIDIPAGGYLVISGPLNVVHGKYRHRCLRGHKFQAELLLDGREIDGPSGTFSALAAGLSCTQSTWKSYRLVRPVLSIAMRLTSLEARKALRGVVRQQRSAHKR
jgi:hypothetical protein